MSGVLSGEQCTNFESHGFDLEQLDGEREAGGIRLDCYQKDLPQLWLFTAKLGAPHLEYEYTSRREQSISIGGTGLWD